MEDELSFDKWGLYNQNQRLSYRLFLAQELANTRLNRFYVDKSKNSFKPSLNIFSRLKISDSLSHSDFIFVPHPWISIKNNSSYRNYLYQLSKTTPLLISNDDDISPKCDLPNTLQFRSSLHPRENPFRKIILPYMANHQPFKERNWKPIPQVSFMGFVPKLGLGSLTSKSSSFLHSPIKSSVYLNRKISVNKLRKLDKNFKVTVVERDTFTLLTNNPNQDLHRREFRENLLESDYVLCPRGFGNFSIRLYETLSSGATPILINSGKNLPELEDNTFWSSNIITLELFSDWQKIIQEDWESLKLGNAYADRQIQNREVFIQELDVQKYSEKIFSNYLK